MEEHVALAQRAATAGLIVTELMPLRTKVKEYAVQLWTPDGALWAEGRYESAESVRGMISDYLERHPQQLGESAGEVDDEESAECAETDYDRRGDCDGGMKVVKLLVNHAGGRAGEYLCMCFSHARQAATNREVLVIRPVTPTRD